MLSIALSLALATPARAEDALNPLAQFDVIAVAQDEDDDDEDSVKAQKDAVKSGKTTEKKPEP